MYDILITRPYGIGNAVQAIPALRLLEETLKDTGNYALWLEDRPSIELLKSQFAITSSLLTPGLSVRCKYWLSFFPPDSAMMPKSFERLFGYPPDEMRRMPESVNWNEVDTNVKTAASFLNIHESEYNVPSCRLWPYNRQPAKPDLIGIHPGCQKGDGGVWLRKRWPVENWKLLIKTLIARDKKVMVFGTTYADSKALIPLMQTFDTVPDKVLWCIDYKPFEAVEQAGYCEAFISNDSGMAHLALASGCQKVIILYGPTRPAKNTHDGAIPLSINGCRHQPCYGEVFSPDGIACVNNRCMNIPVRRVLEALL